MYARAARVRIAPEAMTKLLGLPENTAVMRFSVLGDGAVACDVVGDTMPEVVGSPVVVDISELPDLFHSPAKAAPVEHEYHEAVEEEEHL